MKQSALTKATLGRLPGYLQYLQKQGFQPGDAISATTIARELRLGEVQVRKDLALVSGGGRPKIGYQRLGLVEDIEQFLGYDNTNDAVLIGAGKLGRALLGYSGFSEYGLNIVAAFDSDASVAGTDASGKPVLPLSALEDLCSRRKILIGILTVPAAAAQGVCDLLIRNGIKAIWNFAPLDLKVPDNVVVNNVHLTDSLLVLTYRLHQLERAEEEQAAESAAAPAEEE